MSTHPIWFGSVGCRLPQSDAIAPYVRLGIELEVVDALRGIPLERPLAGSLSLQPINVKDLL